MAIVQVEDSPTIGSEAFLEFEDQEAKRFVSMVRKSHDEKPIRFNGIKIQKVGKDSICITQAEKIKNLNFPKSEKKVASQHALERYISVNCSPDVCATMQLIASGIFAVF